MGRKLRGVSLACAAFLTAGTIAFSGMPEPDNLVYGNFLWRGEAIPFEVIGVKVEARMVLDTDDYGAAVAAYTVGSREDEGKNFVVNLKVDSGEISRPNALLPGQKFALFVNGQKVSEVMSATALSSGVSPFRRINLELSNVISRAAAHPAWRFYE